MKEIVNKITRILFLFVMFGFLTFQALANRKKEHKGFSKLKPRIRYNDNKLTWYIEGAAGKFVHISFATEETEVISIYFDDSLCYRDTINKEALQYSDYQSQFGMKLNSEKPNWIYVYLEKSKMYYAFRYNSKYSYIRISHIGAGMFPTLIEFSNNIPLDH